METATSPDPLLATLQVRSGSAGEPILGVCGPNATIGADSDNAVVLEGSGVAARHAELRLRGGLWSLIDLGPAGGLWVDGQVVRGETLLAPGSAIRMGEVVLAFAPEDRWENSPPERRSEERSPILVMPTETPSISPKWWMAIGLVSAAIAAYFLFFRTA